MGAVEEERVVFLVPPIVTVHLPPPRVVVESRHSGWAVAATNAALETDFD